MTPCTSRLGSLLALTGALAGHIHPYQKIDPDQIDAYKRAFDEFDLDGDGKISTKVKSLQHRLSLFNVLVFKFWILILL